MTIAEAREKCKAFVLNIPRDVLIIVVLILASSASFGFGYLAGIDVGQSSAVNNTPSPQPSPNATAGTAEASASEAGNYVASKNGTKYYLPSCAGASQISDANKVWFASEADAEAAGYTRATNCKGL
jgi:hypothetical protein